MRIQNVMAVALVGLVAVATPAAAQDSAWSVSFEGGVTRGVKGTVLPFGVGQVVGVPTVIQGTSYGRIYGNGIQVAVGVGRRMSDKAEVRGRFLWSKLEAKRTEVGTRGTQLFSRVFAQLGEDTSMGADIGYRRYLMTGGRYQPYIGGQVGVLKVDGIQVDFDVPGTVVPLTLNDVNMYGSSTVPTAGGAAGVLINLSSSVGIYGNLDVRWRGSLKLTELTNIGLKGGPGTTITNPNPPPATLLVAPVELSEKSRNWSTPVTAGLNVRF